MIAKLPTGIYQIHIRLQVSTLSFRRLYAFLSDEGGHS